MAQGSVKWFNGEKGFGFIAPDGGGPDDVAGSASALDGGGKSPCLRVLRLVGRDAGVLGPSGSDSAGLYLPLRRPGRAHPDDARGR